MSKLSRVSRQGEKAIEAVDGSTTYLVDMDSLRSDVLDEEDNLRACNQDRESVIRHADVDFAWPADAGS